MLPLSSLEIDDLRHRWGNCFVAFPSADLVGQFINYANGVVAIMTEGNEKHFKYSDAEFKVPHNQYVNVFSGKEHQGIYIYKTGARYFKKGFSLASHGGNNSRMFDAVSPLLGRIRALNCTNPDDMVFVPHLSEGIFGGKLYNSFTLSKITKLHFQVAKYLLLNNSSFLSIKKVLELVLAEVSLGLAISPQFYIGVSSNTNYDAELYCGLIPVGFIKAKSKTIFVNGPIAQEVSDFLISSEQTDYEIISV